MSRDDSILYTGQTSASRRAEKIQARKREKAEKQSVLLPNERVLIELLDKERDATIQALLSLVNGSTPDEDVKSLIVSLNLYKQSIANVKSKLNTILRRANSERELIDE